MEMNKNVSNDNPNANANSNTSSNANNKPESKIFRYKFSDDIIALISEFSKLHKLDDRKIYKENWNTWVKINEDIIKQEVERLQGLGFEGDVIDKMFKAGRYYFREKKNKNKNKNKNEDKNKIEDKDKDNKAQEEVADAADAAADADAVKKKRSYVTSNSEFIKSIDEHIHLTIQEPNFKPQHSFTEFVKENKDILQIEVRRLCSIIDNGTHKQIMTKLKKTFNNRYFIISNK